VKEKAKDAENDARIRNATFSHRCRFENKNGQQMKKLKKEINVRRIKNAIKRFSICDTDTVIKLLK